LRDAIGDMPALRRAVVEIADLLESGGANR
jgi:hypothetical protein